MSLEAVVFDLGGVLVDWNPRHLYRKIFRDDEAGMERFLAEVCNGAWNEQQDGGRPWAEAIAEATLRHPAHAANIRAFRERWPEMLAGAFDETVAILAELKAAGLRVLALTNWSAETFPIAEERFAFFRWFEGIVVSGREGVMKPDPAVFRLVVERYRLAPSTTLFIDDNRVNVEAAIREGWQGLCFSSAAQLRRDLARLGLSLPPIATTR